MTSSVRKLRGWPPQATSSLPAPATATELARARQTGQTVKQLRDEQARHEAAEELRRLLAEDEDNATTMHGVLGKRRRWALHLAVGVLMSKVRPHDQ